MLTQENIDKLRTLLTQAIDNHLANGGKIVSGKFYNDADSKEYCPVSCLVGPTLISGNRADDITAKLGARFTHTDLWRLVDGFDGHEVPLEEKNSDLYKLGQELRAKYLPVVNP